MENKEKTVPISVYKKLICDMIMEMNDIRFIRQIYSIMLRENKKRAGF